MLDCYDKYNNEVVNWVNEWVEEPKDYSTERILFIGDSVTRVLCSYIRKYGFTNKECLVDLLACSVPIDTTLLEHFKEISHFKERPYKNLVLFVTRHMRKYKIEEYEEYVRGLLDAFGKVGNYNVVLVGASRDAVDEERNDMLFERNHLFCKLASEKGYCYIDAEDITLGSTEHYVDTCHYNEYLNMKFVYEILNMTKWNKRYNVDLSELKDEIDQKKGTLEVVDITSKNEEIIRILSCFIELKKHGKSIAEVLYARGYKIIAIYGMGYIGKSLLNVLDETKIRVEYYIDNNPKIKQKYEKCFGELDYLQKVDAIIVTPFWTFESIKNKMSKKMNCPVVSIQEIIDEMMELL